MTMVRLLLHLKNPRGVVSSEGTDGVEEVEADTGADEVVADVEVEGPRGLLGDRSWGWAGATADCREKHNFLVDLLL